MKNYYFSENAGFLGYKMSTRLRDRKMILLLYLWRKDGPTYKKRRLSNINCQMNNVISGSIQTGHHETIFHRATEKLIHRIFCQKLSARGLSSNEMWPSNVAALRLGHNTARLFDQLPTGQTGSWKVPRTSPAGPLLPSPRLPLL